MQQTSRSSRTALAAVADLMFASRIRGTAESLGVRTEFARTEDALFRFAPECDVVLLDLGARWLDAASVIARLKQDEATRDIPIVAFGSHVDTAVLDAARNAGADRVLPRSAFVRTLGDLLRGELR